MVVDGKAGTSTMRFLSPFTALIPLIWPSRCKKRASGWLSGTAWKAIRTPIATLPSFSPDSRHFVYMAQKDGKWRVVVDGKEGNAYDGVSIPAFSPDSRHLAYAALSQKTWMIVVDGEEGTK